MIKNALLSSARKDDELSFFASRLVGLGFNIISSGGTADFLSRQQIPVEHVEQYTKMPPILGHRIVTMHPAIIGGLIADEDQRSEVEEMGYPWIDLAYFNFYPLVMTTTLPNATLRDVLEKTDIGGPALVRAAAKGRRIIVVSPEDFDPIIKWIEGGMLDKERVLSFLACKAERVVSDYCAVSFQYHGKAAFTPRSDGIFHHIREDIGFDHFLEVFPPEGA